MKPLIFIIVFLTFIITVSCEKSEYNEDDLLGEWITVVFCDSCLRFEFTSDKTLYLHFIGKGYFDEYQYDYKRNNNLYIKSDDSEGDYPIIFHTQDSIEIVGFRITYAFPEKNSILKRIKK